MTSSCGTTKPGSIPSGTEDHASEEHDRHVRAGTLLGTGAVVLGMPGGRPHALSSSAACRGDPRFARFGDRVSDGAGSIAAVALRSALSTSVIADAGAGVFAAGLGFVNDAAAALLLAPGFWMAALAAATAVALLPAYLFSSRSKSAAVNLGACFRAATKLTCANQCSSTSVGTSGQTQAQEKQHVHVCACVCVCMCMCVHVHDIQKQQRGIAKG